MKKLERVKRRKVPRRGSVADRRPPKDYGVSHMETSVASFLASQSRNFWVSKNRMLLNIEIVLIVLFS